MTTARLLIGDVFARMAELPDGSVDLVMTSPPFLALRSYLPEGHPDKGKEIGSEATPAEFLDTLLALTAEWGRLLAPHGSICVELGDTYAGSGGAGGDYGPDGLRDGQPRYKQSDARRNARVALADGRTIQSAGIGNGQERTGAGWPLDKSLCGIPTLYAWSLAYGRNLLTGEESPAGRWRVRNLVAWVRPNPPVGALGDKFRPATSYLTVATRARDRYFDLDSVRSGAPDSSGPAGWAVPSIADTHVVPTTLHTDGRLTSRGWCNPGQSKVSVSSSVAWQAQRLEVVEPVRFLVGVEQVEGPKVVDLQSAGRPADLALVPVTVERFLAGSVPVASPIAGSSAVPTGVVLASEVDAPPVTGTFEAAEVVRQDLALVAGQWLAARITLHLDGACRTAFAVAPIASATHGGESSSKYPTSGNGAPPLDWWQIAPTGFKGSHYAVYPPELCVRPILAMSPQRVCTTCGQPSRRITVDRSAFSRQPELAAHIKERREALGITSAEVNGWFGYKEIAKNWERTDKHGAAIPNPDDWLTLSVRLGLDRERFDDLVLGERRWAESTVEYDADGQRLGPGDRRTGYDRGGSAPDRSANRIKANRVAPQEWSDCGHGTWRPGHVLDPFAGSGTTLAVATGHSREATGIDLDPRNAALAQERCGMFLTIDEAVVS